VSTSKRLALLLLLMLPATLAYAMYVPAPCDNPSRQPGPPHSWGGSHPGPAVLSEGTGVFSQKVNTYTGNLTLAIKAIPSQDSGGDIPFMLYYNSRPWLMGEARTPVGGTWTHSHNVYLIPQYGQGAWLVRGNGQVCFFAKSAVGSTYVSPRGVSDTLEDSGDGGWVLATERGRSLRFDRDGKLLRIAGADGGAWTLSYTQGERPRLASITDPRGRRTQLSYQHVAATGQYVLAEIAVSDGRRARLEYDEERQGRGFLAAVTDSSGRKYRFAYENDRLARLVTPSGQSLSYAYTDDELGEPRTAGISTDGKPGALVTYQYQPRSPSQPRAELRVDIKSTDGPALRHVYDDSGGTSSSFGALLRVVGDPGESPHRNNVVQSWVYDSRFHRGSGDDGP
jgi:YD repeat-containing protein